MYAFAHCFVFVKHSHWMTACMVVWTGRCRCCGCMSWGSAAWPASSPGQPSGSASYSGSPPLVFAVGVGMGNSLLSPLCDGRGCAEKTVFRQLPSHCIQTLLEWNYAIFACRRLYPLRRRYHQAPSMRPPAQPPWLRVSQEIRFWGDSRGVMWPIDWMEILSDATAREESGQTKLALFHAKTFSKNIKKSKHNPEKDLLEVMTT